MEAQRPTHAAAPPQRSKKDKEVKEGLCACPLQANPRAPWQTAPPAAPHHRARAPSAQAPPLHCCCPPARGRLASSPWAHPHQRHPACATPAWAAPWLAGQPGGRGRGARGSVNDAPPCPECIWLRPLPSGPHPRLAHRCPLACTCLPPPTHTRPTTTAAHASEHSGAPPSSSPPLWCALNPSACCHHPRMQCPTPSHLERRVQLQRLLARLLLRLLVRLLLVAGSEEGRPWRGGGLCCVSRQRGHILCTPGTKEAGALGAGVPGASCARRPRAFMLPPCSHLA